MSRSPVSAGLFKGPHDHRCCGCVCYFDGGVA